MKKLLHVMLSVLLFLADLWIGTYIIWSLKKDSWAQFPAVMTVCLAGIGCIVWFSYSINNEET